MRWISFIESATKQSVILGGLYMKCSEKIVQLRKQHGLSQENLAEKLSVSRQAVSRWEIGTAMPDATNILLLSKLFDVTTDYLLNDDYESDEDLPKVRKVKFISILFFVLLLYCQTLSLSITFKPISIMCQLFRTFYMFIVFIKIRFKYQKIDHINNIKHRSSHGCHIESRNSIKCDCF